RRASEYLFYGPGSHPRFDEFLFADPNAEPDGKIPEL
ncbi:unnamed protein product, partial [Rotaria sp. Silwood1]